MTDLRSIQNIVEDFARNGYQQQYVDTTGTRKAYATSPTRDLDNGLAVHSVVAEHAASDLMDYVAKNPGNTDDAISGFVHDHFKVEPEDDLIWYKQPPEGEEARQLDALTQALQGAFDVN